MVHAAPFIVFGGRKSQAKNFFSTGCVCLFTRESGCERGGISHSPQVPHISAHSPPRAVRGCPQPLHIAIHIEILRQRHCSLSFARMRVNQAMSVLWWMLTRQLRQGRRHERHRVVGLSSKRR